jgi:hypothetical protein
VNRARSFDLSVAAAALGPRLSTFWSKPLRTTSLIIAALGSIFFIGFLSLVLSGRAAVLVLDHPSRHFLYPFTIQNIMHMIFFIGLGER